MDVVLRLPEAAEERAVCGADWDQAGAEGTFEVHLKHQRAPAMAGNKCSGVVHRDVGEAEGFSVNVVVHA